MFSSLKNKVKSKLIFKFIEKYRPFCIEILNQKRMIEQNIDEVIIDLIDSSINEFKIYDCKAYYKNIFGEYLVNSSISVYYDQINYYLCGCGKYSAEIIFSDFVNKNIQKELCKIKYKNENYFPEEDFFLYTRRRINFINIEIQDLELPKDLKNNVVNIDTTETKNYLILISIVKEPKIIGVYTNEPLIEDELNYKESEMILFFKNSLEKINNIININVSNCNNDEYVSFINKLSQNQITEYKNEIINSFSLEVKISKYFVVYREKLTEQQIQLYELYSEFMIHFPDFQFSLRKNKKINERRYLLDYYYSKRAITNFYNSLPSYLNKSEKVKLKYAACRFLRILFNHGYGEYFDDLFEFLNFDDSGTIYNDANEFNKKFVNLLTEKSEIFPFLLQLNSGSSFNLLTNELTSRISMLNINDIKKHLISTIPKYGIRLKKNSFFNACTLNDLKITCICEVSFFAFFLNNNELKSINDNNYNKRYRLVNLMQHENFGHIKFSLNFFSFYNGNLDIRIDEKDVIHHSEPISPKNYYRYQGKEEIIEIVKEKKVKDKIITIGESGIGFTTFMTRGKYKLMKLLNMQGIDFKNLFEHPEYMAAEDLSTFISELEKKNADYGLCDEETDNIEYKSRFCESENLQMESLGIPTLEKYSF